MYIDKEDKVYLIDEYTNKLTPIKRLADEFNVTRQAIYKIFKQEGVDTSKRKIMISCDACGDSFPRHRCLIRNQRHHFCSTKCYTAYLNAGKSPSISNRQGQRVARKKVSLYHHFKEHEVVHHKDRNQLNNMLYNLEVYANQGDHIRHHRGLKEIKPVWRGSDPY